MPRHALRQWSVFEQQLRRTPVRWLFADYDGTLVPIRPRPEQARLSLSMQELLRRAARRKTLSVGIVSGRALATLRQLVGLPGVIYIGNHGLEIRGPSIRFTHPQANAARPMLRRLASQLRRALQEVPGSFVEDKELSLSVHWRRVKSADAARVHRLIDHVTTPWVRARAVRVTSGKRVVEVRPPVAWHKGTAVAWVLKHAGRPTEQVMMLGDDRTDEDAFRTVNRLGGLSVFVGCRPATTAARWWLKSPAEVRMLLRRLAS